MDDLSDEEVSNIISMLPPARGRQAGAEAQFTIVRPIDRNDIADLLEPSTLGSSPPALKRLRTQHHNLARLLASKMTYVEASALSGYSPSRISILLQDPAFKELCTYYESQRDAKFVDVHAKLAGLGEAVVEEMQERLENDPDSFTTGMLIKVGEFALDRSSAPPKTKATAAGQGLPQIKISFHKGQEPEQLTIEAAPQEVDEWLGE